MADPTTSTMAQNVALLATAYTTRTAQTVPFVFGENARHLFSNTAPPRVIVVPTEGDIQAAGDWVGPHRNTRTATQANGVVLSWALETADVYCIGADGYQTDTLWRNVIALLQLELTNVGLHALGKFTWLTEEHKQAGLVCTHPVIVQQVTFRTNITDVLQPLTILTGTEQEGYIGTDEGCQCLPT